MESTVPCSTETDNCSGREGRNEESDVDSEEEMEESSTDGCDELECTMFNGKPYRDLNIDDLKNVRFGNLKEAERFYLYYSVAKGFSMRKHRQDWNSGHTAIIRREMVCSRQGKRKERLNDSESSVCGMKKMKRPSTKTRRVSRCLCSAKVIFNREREGSSFYVSSFVTEHNHDLTLRKQKQFMRSNRGVKDHDIAQVKSLRSVSVGTARAFEFLVHQAGGHEFVGFTERDLYNKVQREHGEIMMDGDAQVSVTWMNLKAVRDPNFYCVFSVDEEGRLANMFWRDGESYNDYVKYEDVLIFDSTYKTNIYDRPLAVFVGTNNHRATVIFGCALLVDETEETYNWVLTAFLTSMKNKHPISVVTDSEQAMKISLVNVMPEARHRLCAWHVGKNVMSHLREPDTQRDFFHLIFAGLTREEWEASWEYFVSMNKLENNSWVNGMYEKKEMWAEAFFREGFFAGICSTQRCEGMHRNLKLGLGRCMRLYELFPRLEKTVARIRNKVMFDDYKSEQFSPVYKSHMRMVEEDIGELFTHDVFLLIRDQIMYEVKFNKSPPVEDSGTGESVVTITQYGKPDRTWQVRYLVDGDNTTFCCSCKLFESDGIPCCHMFSVIKGLNLTKLPPCLVNKRWTKVGDAQLHSSSNGEGNCLQIARYGELMSTCSKICHIASHSELGYDEVKEVLRRLTIEAGELPQPKDMILFEPEACIDVSNGLHRNVIKDPIPCRSKGTKSKAVGGKKSTTKRKCTKCGGSGHDRRTCVVGDMSGKSKVSQKLGSNNALDGHNSSDGGSGWVPSSATSETSEDDVEDVGTSNSDSVNLFHHREEGRSLDYIFGNTCSPSSSRGGAGDYFRHFRPFTDLL